MLLQKSAPQTKELDWSGVFYKVVNKHRPSTFLVIIPKIIVHGYGKVKKKILCVFLNRSVVMLLQKSAPQTKELEPSRHYDVSVCQSHF